MNIHVDKNFYNNIINNTVYYKFTIGSHLYNLNDDKSDKDYLIVYHPFYNQIIDPFSNHHQFQYKDIENNIDYNLVDVITFIKNLVSGDSTINYEIIHADEIKYTDLNFLHDYKNEFSTFNITKAYLGFAKRDVKHFNKRINLDDKRAGLLHILRCNYIAYFIIHENEKNINIIYDILKPKKNIIDSFRFISEFSSYLIKEEEITNNLRKELTVLHNKNKITKYLKPDVQNIISENMKNILKISKYELSLDHIHYHNENIEFKY